MQIGLQGVKGDPESLKASGAPDRPASPVLREALTSKSTYLCGLQSGFSPMHGAASIRLFPDAQC